MPAGARARGKARAAATPKGAPAKAAPSPKAKPVPSYRQRALETEEVGDDMVDEAVRACLRHRLKFLTPHAIGGVVVAGKTLRQTLWADKKAWLLGRRGPMGSNCYLDLVRKFMGERDPKDALIWDPEKDENKVDLDHDFMMGVHKALYSARCLRGPLLALMPDKQACCERGRLLLFMVALGMCNMDSRS